MLFSFDIYGFEGTQDTALPFAVLVFTYVEIYLLGCHAL